MRTGMEQGNRARVGTVTIDSMGDMARVGLVLVPLFCGVLVVPVVILLLDALVRAGRQ